MTLSLRGRARPIFMLLAAVSMVAVIACTGDVGTSGAAGAAGNAGAPGESGVAGAAGVAGQSGIAGAQGPQGPQGPSGPDGAIGAAGFTGDAGSAGSDGETGAVLMISDAGTGIVGVVDLSSSGTRINITGAGFDAGESVSISIGGSEIATATANAGGAIASLGLALPSGLSQGNVVSVLATGGNGTIGWGVLLVTDKDAQN